MAVRRIVPNIATDHPEHAAGFYGGVLGLRHLMDGGFIQTWGTSAGGPQLSAMTEGGSGTPVPDISVEVDDLEQVLLRARDAGAEVTYGPVSEPWGVRRAFLRDPFGRIVNVLMHEDTSDV